MSQIQSREPAMLFDGRMDTTNAARYMGLAPKTLAMYRSAGKGPKFVKRGRVFYYRDDCDDWLKEGRVISTAQARQLEGGSTAAGEVKSAALGTAMLQATAAALPTTLPAEKVEAAPTRAPGKRRPQRAPKKPGPQPGPKRRTPQRQPTVRG